MKSFTFAAAVLAVTAAALNTSEMNYMNHLARQGKTLSDLNEFHERLGYFSQADAFINEHNNSSEAESYRLRHNQFSDFSPAEYSQLLGFKGVNNAEDKKIKVYDVSENKDKMEVDWLAAGAVTPVKNQGQCGSCWAFSATGALEGKHQIVSGTLLSFSEEQLVECSTANDACQGGWQEKAFQYYETSMAEVESVYPYTSGTGNVGDCAYDVKSATAVDVSDYAFVTASDVTQMKAALAEQPLAVSIDANNMQFQFYWDGVFNYRACGDDLDHAVLIVGWGTEQGTGKEYWLLKNSWATTWGENGYMQIAIEEGKGVCGVQMEPLTVVSN